MNDIFMWLVIIILGGAFFGVMVYSFYLLIFSKDNDNISKKNVPKLTGDKLRGKFVGRT